MALISDSEHDRASSPQQPNRENARAQSALKHCQLDHAIFNFATCEPRASDTLKRVPMFVEVAEGLVLRSKRRLETAHLPNRADRQGESNGLSFASLGLRHDLDIVRHGSILSARKSIRSALD
jgi:hypothetical protein